MAIGAIASFAAPHVIRGVGSWLGGRRKGATPAARSGTENRYMRALNRDERAGADMEDTAWEGMRDFDPDAAFRTSAEGAMGDFRREMSDQLRDLTGSAVGAGRLNTGFFDEDRGEVATRLGGQFQDRLAQGAMQTAGMRQQQLGQMGQMAGQRQNRYLELLTGKMDRDTGNENARRDRRTGLLSAGAGLLGSAAQAYGAYRGGGSR